MASELLRVDGFVLDKGEDARGRTALECARANTKTAGDTHGFTEAIRVQFPGEDRGALLEAATARDWARVKDIANVEGARATDARGRLPLHLAAESNAPVEVVDALMLLFSDGATMRDTEGWTPLERAHAKGNTVIESRLTGFMSSNS